MLPFFISKEIVRPGQRDATVLKSLRTSVISTSGLVKNSSLGSHSTSVPEGELEIPVFLSLKTPSIKLTVSNFLSRYVVTVNQCER